MVMVKPITKMELYDMMVTGPMINAMVMGKRFTKMILLDMMVKDNKRNGSGTVYDEIIIYYMMVN